MNCHLTGNLFWVKCFAFFKCRCAKSFKYKAVRQKMTVWRFLFWTVWHTEWVQEHAEGSWKRQLIEALKDYHEEQIYSTFIFKKRKGIFNSLECLFYCASNSSAITTQISSQNAEKNAELMCTDILTSLHEDNMWHHYFRVPIIVLRLMSFPRKLQTVVYCSPFAEASERGWDLSRRTEEYMLCKIYLLGLGTWDIWFFKC